MMRINKLTDYGIVIAVRIAHGVALFQLQNAVHRPRVQLDFRRGERRVFARHDGGLDFVERQRHGFQIANDSPQPQVASALGLFSTSPERVSPPVSGSI